ncbi:hypothetical protein EJ04DRAFT_344716 [Polyplosphaeria fusca]|uniref:Uncharacterized protein n=1 Tax=Polyplosphaeria fusca TaxID=682080 RepID=A0A9P4QT78_9PLEO|nr:hypothetical protein EJ04DRAFT_344716 [Polyplosphaeria fusca]
MLGQVHVNGQISEARWRTWKVQCGNCKREPSTFLSCSTCPVQTSLHPTVFPLLPESSSIYDEWQPPGRDPGQPRAFLVPEGTVTLSMVERAPPELRPRIDSRRRRSGWRRASQDSCNGARAALSACRHAVLPPLSRSSRCDEWSRCQPWPLRSASVYLFLEAVSERSQRQSKYPRAQPHLCGAAAAAAAAAAVTFNYCFNLHPSRRVERGAGACKRMQGDGKVNEEEASALNFPLLLDCAGSRHLHP